MEVIKWEKKLKEKVEKIFKNAKVKKGLAIIGLAIVALAVLFLIFNLSYQNKIFPKTYLGSANFGGLNQAQASAKLTELIAANKDGELQFSWDGENFSKKIQDLDVDYASSSDQTVQSLMDVGRRGSLGKILAEQLRAVFSSNQTIASFKYNDGKLSDFLNEMAKKINKTSVNASIGFNGLDPFVTPAQIGQDFPLSTNKKIALETIGGFKFDDKMAFIVDEIQPAVDTEMANDALGKTKDLINHHLTVNAKDKTYQIGPTEIAGFLDFKTNQTSILPSLNLGNSPGLPGPLELLPQLSTDKIGSYVDTIGKDVNQDAKDAQFKVDNGKVVAFQVAQTGFQIQKDQAVKMIIDAINTGQTTVNLPVKQTNPSVASSDPAQAGLTELVGDGKTSWRGSPANRIYNIELGSSKISGTIVEPGQEFSTLAEIGEVGPQTGYLQELVIKNSTQVVPDYGGGLCQVSTTLFRAALSAGLKITARTAHSFRVSYYEPPVGEDATIYSPAPDFKFVNDMKTPILIWAIAGNNSLEFQIYGTKDGRQSSISNPVVGNYVSPPPPVYTESNTMAAGAVRQVEKALAGCTASFNYKVTTANGQVLENQTFTSKYVALPNSYLYGPGYLPPGATPAPTPTVQGTEAPTPTPEISPSPPTPSP